MLTIFQNAAKHAENTAIVVHDKKYTYQTLLQHAQQFAAELLQDTNDLSEARIAFMVNPGFDYVKVQWGIWLAGGVVVPLCLTHPLPSLQYVIEDTEAKVIVISPEYQSILQDYCTANQIRLIVLGDEQHNKTVALPDNEAITLCVMDFHLVFNS